LSCDTLNRSAVQLSVAAGSLPEGFCPESLQDFFNAMVDRLIISPSTDFNTFVIGSVAPSSNQGPWLKNCEQWYFYDDATGTYKIQAKGGFTTVQTFNTSGSFVVPDEIYKLKIEAWGGGGGGCDVFSGSSQTGGGGGAYGLLIVDVVPGQVINYTVGMGGVNGVPASAGGSTTILGLTCAGGSGGVVTGPASAGGAATGANRGVSGGTGAASFGGSGGSGGDSPMGGSGGKVDTAAGVGQNGVLPGGGGAGGTNSNNTGGLGAGGQIVIQY